MLNKHILFIFGTRPEAIKLASLAQTLKSDFKVSICLTGQHIELIKPLLSQLGLIAGYSLNSMEEQQSLAKLTSKIIASIDNIFTSQCFDGVIVQGDTTSALAGSIAASLHKIPVFHVEAGLRTMDIGSPFPEELNRQLISRAATLHFAPTLLNKDNLTREQIDEKNIFITGNTGIDTLLYFTKRKRKDKLSLEATKSLPFLNENRKQKFILITCHRRESFGNGLENIADALLELASEFPKECFVLPLHYNPNVRNRLLAKLSEQKNIFLTEPFTYSDFVEIMSLSKLIITDSGGIQEEAPSLNIPVVVIRNKTERIEAIQAGTAILAGTERASILDACKKLLRDKNLYSKMSKTANPYGDGKACIKIKNILLGYYS